VGAKAALLGAIASIFLPRTQLPVRSRSTFRRLL
jgi:hypothetical protein